MRQPEPEILEKVPPEIPDPKPVKYMSSTGIEFLKKWEGVRHEAYEDAIGLLTIGVGHLLTKDEFSSATLFLLPTPGHPAGWSTIWRDGISDHLVEELLRNDLESTEGWVLVQAPTLTQTQFDALVSFTFNVGQQAFVDSTLLRKLRKSDFEGAAAEFPRWKYAGGQVLKGPERRREAEREMF